MKRVIDYIYQRRIPILVFVICLYALYLRLMHRHQHELWTDEIFYLLPLNGSFSYLLETLPNNQVFSYLSGDVFIFYPFVKIFGHNKWGLAIPCIISALIGFYLLYLICKRYFRSIWGYLFTFSIVCFNATLILHATEIRTYAMLPTVALAVFYVSQRMTDLNFELSGRKKAAAVLFGIFVIWFHVYGIMIFGISLIFALSSKLGQDDFKKCFKNATLFMAIVLCLAMPFWLYCVLNSRIDHSTMGINPFLFIPNPGEDIIGFLKGVFGNLIGKRTLYILLAGIVFPFLIPYRRRQEQVVFLFIMVFLPTGVIFLADLHKSYWFMQKQFVWVIPLFAFFLGWTWDSLIGYVKEKDFLSLKK